MLVYKLNRDKPLKAFVAKKMSGAAIQAEIEVKASIGQFDFDEIYVDKRLPAADQVYLSLRKSIITCRLPPNTAISENRICNKFGVSRSPVRTALTRLVEDGLVEVFPQRGTFVAPIKLRQVRESQFARSAIEVSLVQEAARHWTKTHRITAESNIQLQKQNAEQGLTWEFYADNERLHELFADAAGLKGVWNYVQSIKMIWDRIGHIANRVPSHVNEIISEHTAIVEALNLNDPEAAANSMKSHMLSIDHAVEKLRPEHNDYFSDE